MSEPFEAAQPELTPSDLLRPPQEPIVFPNILRNDRRWQQLPHGEIVYMNANQPDTLPTTVTMLDQQGHPVQENGHNRERAIDEPQRTPAVVIHTGPRSLEAPYDEIVAKATRMLTRHLTRDHLKRIVEQNLGFLVIVEDKIEGGDNRVGWRKKQLTNHGLVKDEEGEEEVVIETDDKIITLGRIKKEQNVPDFIKTRDSEPTEIPQPKSPDQIKKELISQYKRGELRAVELEECCGDCGRHLKYEYYPNIWIKGDETIELLKRRKVCDSKLHRGMPGSITIGKPETIGRLGWHKNN